MLGTSLNVCGGITAVEKMIMSNAGNNLFFILVPTVVPGSFIKNGVAYWSSMYRLFFLLLCKKIDFVHLHFAERGSTFRKILPATISIFFKCPLILHAHSANYHDFFSLLPSAIRKIVISVFNKCTVFISVSRSWEAYFVNTFSLRANQSVVLYNPVQLPDEIPQRQPLHQPVIFLFLGHIGPRGGGLEKTKFLFKFSNQDKGAFDIIKAYSSLPEDLKSASRIIMAGDGAVSGARELVAKRGVSENITVLSWVNSTQRDELLGKSDVFILPSYHEGLPMSMLEAMAWGMPVIVSAVGGIPEFVANNQEGLLVTPGNINEISDAMQKLIVNSDLRKAMGLLSRKRVEKLSVNKYMSNLTSMYLRYS